MNKKRIYTTIISIVVAIFCFTFSACTGETIHSDDADTNIGNNENEFEGNTKNGDNLNNDEISEGDDMTIKITVENGKTFYAELYKNEAASLLYSKLPLDLTMSDMPHEKYCYLDFSLPVNAQRVQNIHAGDIMLWGNSCLVIFYEDFTTTYSYTLIGNIKDASDLKSVFGSGSVGLTIVKQS